MFRRTVGQMSRYWICIQFKTTFTGGSESELMQKIRSCANVSLYVGNICASVDVAIKAKLAPYLNIQKLNLKDIVDEKIFSK